MFKAKKKEINNEFDQSIKGTSLKADAWRRLKKNKMAIGGLYIIIFYTIISVLAPILPIYSYKKIILDHKHLPPSLTKTAGELMLEKTEMRLLKFAEKTGRSELNNMEKDRLEKLKQRINTETGVINGKEVKLHDRRYLLGTDYHGRDMLARIIYGGQISIAVGTLGALTAVLIGFLAGSVAGFIGGKIDNLIMRIVEIVYSLPFMMIVIIFLALFGQSIFNIFIGIALISWLEIARIVRGQIISLKNAEFVDAARSIGASSTRIIVRHMMPNVMGIVIVFTTLQIPNFILTEAFLSFLGLGISPPFASWGSLLRNAIEGMSLYPWLLFFPALAMVIFMFSINFLGDGLRDAFDPQSKNRI